jgi:hypothetical protein
MRILDLYVEFRNHTNGLPGKRGLLDALTYFGLDGIGATEKEEMRDLVLRGGQWSNQEKADILDYCESDVTAIARLLPALFPTIDLPRAILRGRYMAAVARMEYHGTPIDTALLNLLRDKWESIQDRLISELDANYGLFEGRRFKLDRFNTWLLTNNIPWPVLESGQLDLNDETFKYMEQIYPIVAPLRELRRTLSEMRLRDLQVGRDGYNRCMLSPFASKTGRNQPSNSKFIFGAGKWMRGLIKPPEGYGVAYVDWEQQEFGIAAALSGDSNMLAAYRTGDPYLAFAKQARSVPSDATEETHGEVRDLYKQCALAVQYGMMKDSLAMRINQPRVVAGALLQHHKELYRQFWKWCDNQVDLAMLRNQISTVFGWRRSVIEDDNPRSLQNFPMQANGAEMLRLALCQATEAGLGICAPVHDAILLMAPIERLEANTLALEEIMEGASRITLYGFPLRTERKLFLYPDRYMDKDGREMWDRVIRLLL